MELRDDAFLPGRVALRFGTLALVFDRDGLVGGDDADAGQAEVAVACAGLQRT